MSTCSPSLKGLFGMSSSSDLPGSSIVLYCAEVDASKVNNQQKSTFYIIVLKVWNLFNIVSEKLIFFKFGVEFLQHSFLPSKFFCRNSYSRKYYATKCCENSAYYVTKFLCTEKF